MLGTASMLLAAGLQSWGEKDQKGVVTQPAQKIWLYSRPWDENCVVLALASPHGGAQLGIPKPPRGEIPSLLPRCCWD